MNEPSTATVVRAARNPTHVGAVIITIQCPSCGGRHHHGVEDASEPLGGRISHCRERGYYRLVDPAGLVAKAAAK